MTPLVLLSAVAVVQFRLSRTLHLGRISQLSPTEEGEGRADNAPSACHQCWCSADE